MASAAALQAHQDELHQQMPLLPLATAPKGFANLDVASLADSPAAASKVTRILSKAAAAVQQCQVCSSSSPDLGLLVSTHLDFASRAMMATGGQFACSLCRAVSSPALLLQLATPELGSEDYGRSELLRELFLHFAAVNSAPASITSNPEALAVWVQELACRAYSMQVVANSIKGWKLLGPTGQPVMPGTPGAAVQLLQQLLHSDAAGAAGAAGKAAAAGRKELQADAAEGAAAGKAGKQQNKQQQQQQQQVANGTPSTGKRKSVDEVNTSSKKKLKKHAAAAAAAAAAQQTPKQQQQQPKQQQQQKTSKQQEQKTPKQQQQQTDSVTKKNKKASKLQQGHPVSQQVQPALTPGTAKKDKTGGSSKAAAVPFKTPQVSTSKKAARPAKRRLSDPS